jgi:hypothetical protein
VTAVPSLLISCAGLNPPILSEKLPSVGRTLTPTNLDCPLLCGCVTGPLDFSGSGRALGPAVGPTATGLVTTVTRDGICTVYIGVRGTVETGWAIVARKLEMVIGRGNLWMDDCALLVFIVIYFI